MQIICDTREQEPLKFENYDVKLYRDTLSCGDYTLVGHDLPKDDLSIIIERKKNCLELCTNLGAKWEQFKNELELMRQYSCKQIVVCGPNNFEYLSTRGFTKLPINFIYKQMADIYATYGVAVIFMPNREESENYIFRLFYNLYKKVREENEE